MRCRVKPWARFFSLYKTAYGGLRHSAMVMGLQGNDNYSSSRAESSTDAGVWM